MMCVFYYLSIYFYMPYLLPFFYYRLWSICLVTLFSSPKDFVCTSFLSLLISPPIGTSGRKEAWKYWIMAYFITLYFRAVGASVQPHSARQGYFSWRRYILPLVQVFFGGSPHCRKDKKMIIQRDIMWIMTSSKKCTIIISLGRTSLLSKSKDMETIWLVVRRHDMAWLFRDAVWLHIVQYASTVVCYAMRGYDTTVTSFAWRTPVC